MVRRSRPCAGKGRSAPDENRRKRQKLNRLDAIASFQCVAHWEAAFALRQGGTADPGIRATGAIKLLAASAEAWLKLYEFVPRATMFLKFDED
jgi:hypothetical protein